LPDLLIQSKEGPLTQVDHVSTSVLNSNSLWHINMKVNEVQGDDGGFLSAYDVELPKAV